MIGLIVGGLWGRSWIDALIKSAGVGILLGGLIYTFLSPETISLLLSRNVNWMVGLGTQIGFLLIGALLGFALRKAVAKKSA